MSLIEPLNLADTRQQAGKGADLNLEETTDTIAKFDALWETLCSLFGGWKKGTDVGTYLILSPVGLSPHSPQKLDGRRMLPATSEPMPSMEPPPAIRAPSPPEEPPGLFWWLRGFKVWPKMGLLQS